MKNAFFAFTIAGSDSGGGAGIQADLKTFSSLGVFGCSAITAITAQNTLGVKAVKAVGKEMLKAQINAVLEDFEIQSIKIGMVFNKENVFAIKETLESNNYKGKVVLDPVMISTQGNNLILSDTIKALSEHLFPLSDIITPNIDEAETLLDVKISTLDDMKAAAELFIEKFNLNAVIIKGGHLEGKEVTDVFIEKAHQSLILKSPKIETKNTHGTGCTLSSAIAAYCAKGISLREAVQNAKHYMTEAIVSAKDINLGHGHGSVNHFFNPQQLITYQL